MTTPIADRVFIVLEIEMLYDVKIIREENITLPYYRKQSPEEDDIFLCHQKEDWDSISDPPY